MPETNKGNQPNHGSGLTAAIPSKVVLCLGAGGVGKTTTAAALALALAAAGERVVVLTIDPARRLADALGLERTGDNARGANQGRRSGNILQAVDGTDGRLWATMLDPAATFETVIRDEARSDEQAERILTNPLFHNLARSLSGTNEYMAAERLHQLYHDERFDRVVVDTPPSRHALDFLDSPGRLSRFINHRLYRSVFAPRSGILRTVSAGGQIILRLLGRLVGSRLVDDVIGFFTAFEGIDTGFDDRSKEITRVLHDDTTMVLVTTARREALAEARWIADNLERRLDRIDAVNVLVANRLCPVDPFPPDPVAADGDDPLARNYAELATVAAQETALLNGFVDTLGGEPHVMKLRERATPVSGLDGLVELGRELDPERL